MSKNSNLHNAKKAKNDEFYTQLSDIEKELNYYRNYFRGKIIYCNCDDPRVSNFFKYFSFNFEKLGLKKLIASCYKSQEVDLFSKKDSEKAIWLEYTGDKNGNRVPDLEEIEIHYFKGDGDFRGPESIEILKQADIIVTNPPFSLFREYVAQLIKYNKKFLIIGNKNAIVCKEIFKLIKENRIWLGYTSPKEFMISGRMTKKVNGLTRWFTNVEVKKRHEDLILYKKYYGNEKEYPIYDNYNAINVDKVKDIPIDYKGIMGVPITFMDKYNPEQFELLGATQRGCHNEVTDTKKYDNYWEVRQTGQKTGSSGSKTNENANLVENDGRKNYFINKKDKIIQSTYHRLFIKRKEKFL